MSGSIRRIFLCQRGLAELDGICYGDARFDTVSESGTATLKARPRVRPLLTFLPLNAQENHGLAVPTPSVPEDFAGKDVADGNSLVNGSLRLYSSVGDLRLEHSGLDPLIPPPPPGPAPGPPQDFPQPPGESPPPPPPSTAPRLSKVPPPAPVRTSSMSLQEAQGAPPEEEGAIKKAPSRLLLPPSFHIRPASQVYPDRATEQDRSREPRAGAPPSPRPSQAEPPTNELAGPLVRAAPPAAEFPKHPKSSLPALKPTPKSKPKLPTPVPEGPSEPADWRDPDQLEQLRSQLAAYFCGPRREDRALGRRLGPTVAAQDKEGKKGLNPPGEVAPQRLPEKRTPEKTPEKTPSGAPEKGPSLPLPPVDYDPQDAPTPSVQQIRKELEARLSASAEKDARPSVGSLPPKPQPGGGSSLTNGTDDRSPKPVAKDLPTLSPTPQPTALLQTTAAPGPATVKPSTPSHLTAEKSWVPAERGGQQEQPEPQEGIVPSQPGPQTHLTGPTGPPTPKDREEMRLFYKPHSHRSSPSLEAATETPTLARGEATGPGGPVGARGPQVGPATPPVLSPPSDQPLRHPVTGEVVERGSPMALLLAARQRAQKGRPGGLAMGRSLPGSLRGHGGLLESRSDGVFPMDCKPNSFTVVPKEADKVTLLASERKSPGSAEPSSLPQWTAVQPRGPRGTWDRPVPSSLPQDPLLPRSLSSPPSPFCRQQDKEEEEFTFEVIPPPPEFSNDPVPSAPKDLGRPLGLAFPRALAFPRLPPAMGRSYVNTFTVRPGTRHPISYAYPRAHRKATP
ncbi:uncharacterized protein C6orf132 homolog [Fukomys damarensis]|uniref:uncharacterized protein C6orf132 homolog n=1 Tax=Fukomys damarensis TaxID=885580 RepID=UPI00053FEB2A|nr:uncharacterized protein C6orf132 homolog [Fukomys damarensis]